MLPYLGIGLRIKTGYYHIVGNNKRQSESLGNIDRVWMHQLCKNCKKKVMSLLEISMVRESLMSRDNLFQNFRSKIKKRFFGDVELWTV